MKSVRGLASVVLVVSVGVFIVPDAGRCADSMTEGLPTAKAVNLLAVDLYHQARDGENNLFFSPYSISMSLTMAYAGARERTASQMARALHFSLNQQDMAKDFRLVNGYIVSGSRQKGAQLNVATALWADKSFSVAKEFLESVDGLHKPPIGWLSRIPIVSQVAEFIEPDDERGLRQLDFRNTPTASRAVINNWVAENTRGRIEDLVPPTMITSNTRLVLTSAIYFKAFWASQFEAKSTSQEPFTLLDGSVVWVPMMSQRTSCGYGEDAELKVLEIPYRGEDLVMVVLLPARNRRFADFERSLTFDKLCTWIGKLRYQKVQVYMPRFKATSTLPLRPALARLGVIDAFSMADADFSGMTGGKDLYIEEGIHKAFVDVNEQGTEAAAATAGSMGWSGADFADAEFRADHPFVFFIAHKPSHCILFFGRVTKLPDARIQGDKMQ